MWGEKRTPAEPVLVLLAGVAGHGVALWAALCYFEAVAGDDDVGCVGTACPGQQFFGRKPHQ